MGVKGILGFMRGVAYHLVPESATDSVTNTEKYKEIQKRFPLCCIIFLAPPPKRVDKKKLLIFFCYSENSELEKKREKY